MFWGTMQFRLLTLTAKALTLRLRLRRLRHAVRTPDPGRRSPHPPVGLPATAPFLLSVIRAS